MSKSNKHSQLTQADKLSALKSSAREMRVDTLRNVGYIDGHKVIPSKRDKAMDAARQRRNFKQNLNRDYGV